ncbi:MAG: alanine--tRNA ligase-related protein, partial [Fimbriiglobus sp.]
LVNVVVEQMGGAFPELKRDPQKVRSAIYDEEVGFLRTLDRGIKLFELYCDFTVDHFKLDSPEKIHEFKPVFAGSSAFKLHDTYGIYIDIVEQMAAERNFTVDRSGFDKLMEGARNRSREGGKKHTVTAVKGELPKTDDSPKYGTAPITATVLGWVLDNEVVTAGKLAAGDTAAVLLDRTTFYGEQGGQVGDAGTLHGPGDAEFQVEDTQRLGDTVLHFGTLLGGELAVGDAVDLMQSTFRRIDVMRNHTATHLMNLALRQVLGHHVEQKGSLVDDDKTRFDFSHDKPLSADEIRAVEDRVNQSVIRDFPVTALTMPLGDAKQIAGVRAMFGEKYPDPVRVVLIGPETPEAATQEHSVEFCGGTHMPRTGAIGYFKIIEQGPVAKGVRRVTAVTGRVATDTLRKLTATVDELSARF